MQIRPHFDYCDIIYHKPIITHDFNCTLTLNYNMDLLEKTQYQSALAITGAWQGTNTDKIYEELGWESLHNRRFCRRLIMIYKILNNLSPNYLRLPLPVTQNIYALRRNLVLNPIYCRKLKYKHSFYPDAIDSWNRIDNDLKNSTSLRIFKSSLLKIIRPNKKAIFDLVDPVGTKWLFQLRVGLSPLNEHKAKHKFSDTPYGNCDCSANCESTKHYLLECPLHDQPRQILLNSLNPLLFLNDLDNITNDQLVHLLLYGHDSLDFYENKLVLKHTIRFLRSSARFPT